MKDLRLRDLLDLASAHPADPKQEIQQMYKWHFERCVTASKLILGAAASLIAALLIAFFKEEFAVPVWQIGIALVGAIGTLLYGAYRFTKTRRVHAEYIASLLLFEQIQPLVSFMRVYRAMRRS
ncbi:hypothetical protein ACFLSZ_07315 [Candidatus Bipolaricaulota bacterium]